LAGGRPAGRGETGQGPDRHADQQPAERLAAGVDETLRERVPLGGEAAGDDTRPGDEKGLDVEEQEGDLPDPDGDHEHEDRGHPLEEGPTRPAGRATRGHTRRRLHAHARPSARIRSASTGSAADEPPSAAPPSPREPPSPASCRRSASRTAVTSSKYRAD